jgi:iron complex outermembrane recepter protein
MKQIFIAVVFILASKINYAQVTKDSIKIKKEVEVQVTAIRASAKAPFSKTTISRTDLEAINLGQDLPFLLNQTPSVLVNSDAGNGIGYTGIRIRGTDATRINFTVNGVPYNDPESQGVFLVNMPDLASSINSIQIQRGVGSSSNGAGAFGATLSISTNQQNELPTLEFNNSYGSFNTIKNTLKFSTGLKNKMYFDGRLSNVQSDGYIDRASSKMQSAMGVIGYKSNKTDIKFNVITGKEKTYQSWNGVEESVMATNRTYNSAGTEKQDEPYDNETDNYWQTQYQLIWNQKIKPNLNFSTVSFLTKGKGYYEQYKADAKYSNYGLPNYSQNNVVINKTDLVRQLWLKSNYYGQTFALVYNKKNNELTIGGMVSKYDGNHYGQIVWAKQGIAKNYKWYDLDATKKDNNLYIKWQSDFDEKFTFYSDVQYRNVQYIINGFRNNPMLHISNNYNFLNPKIGLNYWDKLSNWKGSISIAKATKEPNRDDFEANTNQLPKPEQLQDVEINVEKKWNAKLQTSTTLYYMNYKNQLILTGKINDVGAYTRENVANSYRAGIELSITYSFSEKWKLTGNCTFSQNKINSFKEYIDNYDNGTQQFVEHNNTAIAYSPNTIAATTITYAARQNFTIQLMNKYVSKQYLNNIQNKLQQLNNYFLQDALLTYTPKIKQFKDCKLIGQINNVFNKKYTSNGYSFSYIYGGGLQLENYYFPQAGINYMVGVNIKL